MAAKSVTVTLRSGVSDATLPNNIKMVYGKNYAISLSDYAKLSRKVRASIVDSTINTSNTIIPLSDGAGNLTLDLAGAAMRDQTTLPSLGGVTGDPFALGEVVQGFDGDAFKLVKAVGQTVAAGDAVVWSDDNATEVSNNTSDAATRAKPFAGVATYQIQANRYGWIQVEGLVPDAAGTFSLNAELKVHSVDGQFADASLPADADLVVGTGISANTEVQLRASGFARRHIKTRHVFLDKN